MIKTEDIPHLQNSTFSTRVVKDIAQNILSFLKSNCTKEGHTYWLFKGASEGNGGPQVSRCQISSMCSCVWMFSNACFLTPQPAAVTLLSFTI